MTHHEISWCAAFDIQHRIGTSGGADRDRTGGLLVANQALSQLSYSPNLIACLSSLVVSEKANDKRRVTND